MRKIYFLFLIFILNFSISRAFEKPGQKALSLIYSLQITEARDFIEKEGVDSPTLMGVLEFYSGNYSLARSHFKEAGEMAAGLQEIKNIVEDTYPITDRFKEIETENFLIRYTGKDKILALYLKDILEKALGRLQRRLEWFPREKIILEIYPHRQSFMKASTLTEEHIKVSGAVGICKFNRLMIVSPRVLQFGYMWPDTAVHELVHLFLGKISPNRDVPLWLNEGFATNLEEIWRKEQSGLKPSQVNHLARSLREDKWVDLDKMKHGMPTLDSREEVSRAFAQVKSMTKFLVEKYGWHTMAEYLKKKASGGQDTFAEVFEMDPEEYKLEWKKELEKAEIQPVEGASEPVYSFADDPVSAVNQWVSGTARTDVNVADRFKSRARHDLAVRKYADALEKDPGNSIILNRKGKSHMELGEINKAIEIFKLAIKHNPSYPPPYLHAASAFMEKENWSKAKEMFREYIYRMPFNPAARRGLLRAAEKNRDRPLAALEKRVLDILNEN